MVAAAPIRYMTACLSSHTFRAIICGLLFLLLALAVFSIFPTLLHMFIREPNFAADQLAIVLTANTLVISPVHGLDGRVRAAASIDTCRDLRIWARTLAGRWRANACSSAIGPSLTEVLERLVNIF